MTSNARAFGRLSGLVGSDFQCPVDPKSQGNERSSNKNGNLDTKILVELKVSLRKVVESLAELIVTNWHNMQRAFKTLKNRAVQCSAVLSCCRLAKLVPRRMGGGGRASNNKL